MQIIYQGERLASLLGEKEIFSQLPEDRADTVRQYHVYLGVPLHCLKAADGKCCFTDADAGKTIDILICRDTQAVLAIVLDAEYREMENVFSGPLCGLPRYFLISDELTEKSMQAAADSVEALLCMDCRAPKQTHCYLHVKSVTKAVRQMKDSKIEEAISRQGLQRVLHRKHLILADNSVSYYGKACGLFLRLQPKQGSWTLMCELNSTDRLKSALQWIGEPCFDKGLVQRLNRIHRGLPAEYAASCRSVSSLQALLDTPLEEFFRGHPQEGGKVNALLNHAQFLSRDSSVTAFGEKEDIATYGDVIYAVWNLREYTGTDESKHSEVISTCEEILWNLTEVLLEPVAKKAVPLCTEKRQNLLKRLAQVRNDNEKYPILSEPVSHYSYAGAVLSDSGFPAYLYSRVLGSYLQYYGLAGCNFRQALQFIRGLRDSDDETEAMDCPMLICDLLVDTVSGALV